MLEQLTSHTGLLREELLARLSRELPEAVDRYTPTGGCPMMVARTPERPMP